MQLEKDRFKRSYRYRKARGQPRQHIRWLLELSQCQMFVCRSANHSQYYVTYVEGKLMVVPQEAKGEPGGSTAPQT